MYLPAISNVQSAVGKTQLVLGLLLSCQLPPPQGLRRPAIYISTEDHLNTGRLLQILDSHPLYDSLGPPERPSLDLIHTFTAHDFQAQQKALHVLPVVLQKTGAGLLVIDSVAANYRAEFKTTDIRGLADRAIELVRLGSALKHIAQEYNVAVVVTNQVSERFDDARTLPDRIRSSSSATPLSSSPILSSMRHALLQSTFKSDRDKVMSLDFQQQFFTGWGGEGSEPHDQLKTPALGLMWANQLCARVVLKMESEYTMKLASRSVSDRVVGKGKKRRFLQLVFAPWTEPQARATEYELLPHGLAAIAEDAFGRVEQGDEETDEFLDPRFWANVDEDEEFP